MVQYPDSAAHEDQVSLPAGSTLWLYTDGLIERRGSALLDSLNELLTASAGAAERRIEALCDHLLAHAPTDHDIAVLTIRFADGSCVGDSVRTLSPTHDLR